MHFSEDEQGHLSLLRQRAEEALHGRRIDVTDLSPDDVQYLLHELQVHQTELDIQNVELRQIQDELEQSRDQYADLYNFAPTGYCTISNRDRILNVNRTLAKLLDVDKATMLRHAFSHYVTHDDQDRYYLYRRRAFETKKHLATEIRLVKKSGEAIYVRLESMIANDDQSKLMIMVIDITEQRDLQHRLVVQREKERQKIARDLHDGPIQELAAMSFTLQSILMDHPNTELADTLGEVRDSLREQMQVLRGYSVELRPPLLAHLGVELALHSYVENFGERHPDILIRLALHPIGSLISEEEGLALFRICQEALNNISLHTRKTTTEVIVRLDVVEDHVRLEVQDNGAGFELPDSWFQFVRDGHLGLAGMRERAEAVDGTLEVQTSPGKGTLIKVLIPVKK